MSSAAITFGRFQPPTTGHLKLIQAVAAQDTDHNFIYASHSQDAKNNPLSYDDKMFALRTIVEQHRISVDVVGSDARNIIEALAELTGVVDDVIVVVGEDRVEDFRTLLEKYNNTPDGSGTIPFSFDSIEVVSAGERDPDASGVTGMSATKMRQAATENDFDSFQNGSPFTSVTDTEWLFNTVQQALGVL